jgi:hypothetical protein
VFPVDFDHDAVRVRGAVGNQPFVTPDVIIPPLRVAVEWDGGGHRVDSAVDHQKERVLEASGWVTIRASVHLSTGNGNTIAAPKGLTLAVVRSVMDQILEIDPSASARVGAWHAVGRWQGSALYDDLAVRAGRTAEGASSWRRR